MKRQNIVISIRVAMNLQGQESQDEYKGHKESLAEWSDGTRKSGTGGEGKTWGHDRKTQTKCGDEPTAHGKP